MSEHVQTLIERLNVILSWELAGVVQYLHCNAMLMGPERVSFGEFFEEGSEEARDHAQSVAAKIAVLGGVPTVEPAMIRTARTLDEMLLNTLELEKAALKAWEDALEVAEAANKGTAFWIEEMIAEEQEHVDELTKLTTKPVASSNTSGSVSQVS